MQNADKTELQALLNLNNRILNVESLAVLHKDSAKAIKLCLKLVKFERKDLKVCTAVPEYEVRELQQRYADLEEILKRLAKASSDGAKNKAVEDLYKLIEKTQNIISALNEQLNPLSENVRKLAASIDGKAQKLSEKLESGAQKLSNKVNEAVDGIMKKIAAVEAEGENN